MAEPHLYLATPCHGGQVNLFFLRAVFDLQRACRERGIGLTVDLLPNDHLIARARARLAARFLSVPQATHLFFVDADIGFAPADAFRLLDAGRDVAAGVYPVKSLDWERVRAAAQAGAADLMGASLSYVVRFLPNADNRVEVEDGFAQVAYAGAGFLLIRRAALQRVVDAHPELTANVADSGGPAQAAMVFDTMIEPETGHYLSEDYAFCRRWRDLGGEIWAEVEARLTHVGQAAYAGRLLDALKPG